MKIFQSVFPGAAVVYCLIGAFSMAGHLPANNMRPELLAEAQVQVNVIAAPDSNDNQVLTQQQVKIQFEFTVFDRSVFTGLELATGRLPTATWRLNDRPVLTPVRGLTYRRIPGINPGLLKDGNNILEGFGTPSLAAHGRETIDDIVQSAPHDHMAVTLRGLQSKDLTFRRGPLLSNLTQTSVVVTCQLNMRAPTMLQIDDRSLSSKPGLFHVFKITDLEPGQTYEYSLSAILPDSDETVQTGPFSFSLPSEDSQVRLAILGYSGAPPNQASRTAAAILSTRPHSIVLTGPLTHAPWHDEEWDVRFLQPCAMLWRSVPICLLPAPLERESPLLPLLIPRHGADRNWSRHFGSVHVIGLDSTLHWKPGVIHTKWLKQKLDESKAPFVFVIIQAQDHESTLSAADAGRQKNLDNFLLPLLAQRKVSAVVMPDLRLYERNEVPGRPCLVGGLPVAWRTASKKDVDSETSPQTTDEYFLLIDADDSTCMLRAVGLDLQPFDSRIWEPHAP